MALETSERIQRTERAGIPVHWADLPGPFTAALAFRVGAADERLPQRGITHLVEHVALSTLGRREHPFNGCVDAATTVFGAEGERDEVLEFLRLVAGALCELPDAHFEIERRVLRAEAEGHDPGVVGRLLDHRFGSSGFGLVTTASSACAGSRERPARVVRSARHARERRGVDLGEPPQDLGIALPDGIRRPQPRPSRWTRAAGLRGGGLRRRRADRPRRTLDGAADRDAAGGRALYDTVRSERGLAYAPSGDYSELDARLGHAFLGSDCQDEDAPVVLDALWRTVRTLAADGATADELDRYRRRAARALGDPERGAVSSAITPSGAARRPGAQRRGARARAGRARRGGGRRRDGPGGPQRDPARPSGCPPPGDELEPLRPRRRSR